MPRLIIAALFLMFGFMAGVSFSVEQHRERCTQLGGIPVTQFINRVTTILCQK